MAVLASDMAWCHLAPPSQVDHAYHGHTSLCIDLSPYKFKGPGGGGRPAYVHVLPCPDGAHDGSAVVQRHWCEPCELLGNHISTRAPILIAPVLSLRPGWHERLPPTPPACCSVPRPAPERRSSRSGSNRRGGGSGRPHCRFLLRVHPLLRRPGGESCSSRARLAQL